MTIDFTNPTPAVPRNYYLRRSSHKFEQIRDDEAEPEKNDEDIQMIIIYDSDAEVTDRGQPVKSLGNQSSDLST